jgi:hypothetical protein
VARQIVGGLPTRSSFKKPMSSSQALLSAKLSYFSFIS